MKKQKSRTDLMENLRGTKHLQNVKESKLFHSLLLKFNSFVLLKLKMLRKSKSYKLENFNNCFMQHSKCSFYHPIVIFFLTKLIFDLLFLTVLHVLETKITKSKWCPSERKSICIFSHKAGKQFWTGI